MINQYRINNYTTNNTLHFFYILTFLSKILFFYESALLGIIYISTVSNVLSQISINTNKNNLHILQIHFL